MLGGIFARDLTRYGAAIHAAAPADAARQPIDLDALNTRFDRCLSRDRDPLFGGSL